MEINIPTNINKIHEQYLTFMNIFFNLTPNEIKLISAILTIYKETEGAKENIRWGYVFSKEGKSLIEQQSNMNKNQINLTLSALSKKEYQGNPILQKSPYRAITEGLRVDPISNPSIKIIASLSSDLPPSNNWSVLYWSIAIFSSVVLLGSL